MFIGQGLRDCVCKLVSSFLHCYDSFHNIFDLLAHTLDCFKNMDEIRLKLNDDKVS